MLVRIYTQTVTSTPNTIQLPTHKEMELDAAEVAAITSSDTIRIDEADYKVIKKSVILVGGSSRLDVYCQPK